MLSADERPASPQSGEAAVPQDRILASPAKRLPSIEMVLDTARPVPGKPDL